MRKRGYKYSSVESLFIKGLFHEFMLTDNAEFKFNRSYFKKV